MINHLHFRIDDYIEIPAISDLSFTNQLTMAVCIRGHSKRTPLLEFNAVTETHGGWSPPHLWLISPHVLYAHPGLDRESGVVVEADISEFSETEWVHAAFTMSRQTLQLFVNGVLRETENIPRGITRLSHPLRVGMNPDGGEPTRYIW